MERIWPFALLLLFGYAIAQQQTGLQIISEVAVSQQPSVESFALQYVDATLDCLSAGLYPYNVTMANGTVLYTEVECDTVSEDFIAKPSYFGPWRAIPTISQSCIVMNTQQYNTTSLLQPGLQVAHPLFGSRPTRTNLTRPLGSFLGSLASIGQNIACTAANSWTFGLAGSFGGPCSGTSYLTMDAFSKYSESVSDTFSSIEAWDAGIQNWTTTADQEFRLLLNSAKDTQNYQEANSQAVSALTTVVSNQQNVINQIVEQSSAGINNVQNQLVQTNQNVNNVYLALEALATGTQSEFNQTIVMFAAEMKNMSAQITSLTAQVNRNARIDSSKFMSTQQNFLRLSTALLSLTTQNQYTAPIVDTFRKQKNVINALNVGGANWQFFTENLGSTGVPDPYHIADPNLVTFTIDAPQLRYIYTNSPTPIAIAAFSQIELNCGGFWISLNQYPLQSWTQVINNLGPSNCSVDEILQGREFCNCWMKVTERGCTMPSDGAGLPLPDALAKWQAWDRPGFPTSNSSVYFCDGGQFNLPLVNLTGGIIRNIDDFNSYQIQLCQRGISPAVTGYDVFTPFFELRRFATYSSSTCYSNIMDIMNPPPDATNFNIAYTLMQFYISASSMSATSMALRANAIIGGWPLNSTIINEDNEVIGPGQVQSCKTMVLTAYDMSKFVGGYLYERTTIRKTVKVYVNGQLFSTSENGQIINDHSYLLDELDGKYVSQIPSEQWVDSVYDMDYANADPEPSSFANAGYPKYAAIPAIEPPEYPLGYNISIWRSHYVWKFGHPEGATSYELWRNGLICQNPSPPRRCQCNPADRGPASNGRICELLEYYDATPLSDTETTFTSPYNKLRVTIRFPAGIPTPIAGSACPDVDTDKSIGTNFNLQTVVLTNQLAMVNKFLVRRSGLCGGDDEIELPALASYPYQINYCILEPGVPIVLTYFTQPNGVDFYTPCNTSTSVLITPTNPVIATNGTGAPFETVEYTRRYTANEGAINVQYTQTNTALQIIALATAMQQSMANNLQEPTGGGVAPDPFIPFWNLVNQSASQAAQTYNDSLNNQFSYGPQIANYSAINQKYLDDVRRYNEQAANYTAQLKKDIQDAEVNYYKLLTINGDNAILLNKSQVSLTFLNAVTNQIIADAADQTDFSALSALGKFLVGVGAFAEREADGAVELLKTLGGDAADMFSGGFSGLANIIILIVFIIGLGAVLGLGIWLIVKYGCKPGPNTPEGRLAQLEAQVKMLQEQVNELRGVSNAAPAPATSGRRNRRPSGGCCDSDDCCSSCCCPASRPHLPVAEDDDDEF